MVLYFNHQTFTNDLFVASLAYSNVYESNAPTPGALPLKAEPIGAEEVYVGTPL